MKILKKEMIGLFLIVLGLLFSISIIGYDYTEQPRGLSNPPESLLGYFGVYVGYYCHIFGLGYLSLILPLTLLIAGYTFFSSKSFKEYYKFLTYCFSLCIWLSIFFSILKIEYLSGLIGLSFEGDIFKVGRCMILCPRENSLPIKSSESISGLVIRIFIFF